MRPNIVAASEKREPGAKRNPHSGLRVSALDTAPHALPISDTLLLRGTRH